MNTLFVKVIQSTYLYSMAKEKAKKTARINIKTTPELKKSAEEKAAEKEVSLSRYIEVLIKDDTKEDDWLNS